MCKRISQQLDINHKDLYIKEFCLTQIYNEVVDAIKNKDKQQLWKRQTKSSIHPARVILKNSHKKE